MPELRQNIITREWVVIATERAKRPDQFARKNISEEILPARDTACPFCPGNEIMSTPDILRYDGEDGWRLRIIKNKYAALVSEGGLQRTMHGIYRSMNAFGYHDVVIEHPEHDKIISLMSTGEISLILHSYVDRYNMLREDPRIESIVLFRNHGKNAGTSLVHPHSQIAAVPVVPFQVRSRVDIARSYFDDHGGCMFCRTLNDEVSSGERILCETSSFASFIPYAALSPFHIWIFPKRHSSSFEEITADEIDDLARNLKTVLMKLYNGLNNPDFNFSIRSIPLREKNSEYYHWYLSIIPRISISAGFELGSGMYISTSVPEQSAKYLQDIRVSF